MRYRTNPTIEFISGIMLIGLLILVIGCNRPANMNDWDNFRTKCFITGGDFEQFGEINGYKASLCDCDGTKYEGINYIAMEVKWAGCRAGEPPLPKFSTETEVKEYLANTNRSDLKS